MCDHTTNQVTASQVTDLTTFRNQMYAVRNYVGLLLRERLTCGVKDSLDTQDTEASQTSFKQQHRDRTFCGK